MLKKRICALAICAALSAGSVMPAYAQQVYTASVTQELAASSAVEWNGKTTLKAGQKYVVTKDVTVSKKITVPSGTSLTVKNGAKLWVSTKGSLYIKGTVSVSEGATLAVSGKLYQYKGKKLTVNGTLSMGTKSAITLNGKLTTGENSTVKGEPKTLSVGPNAAVKLNGKCTSKKLNAAIAPAEDTDFVEIKQMLTEALSAVLVDFDCMTAMEKMLPAGVLEAARKAYEAEGNDISFEDAMSKISLLLAMMFSGELGGMPEKVEFSQFSLEKVDPSTLNLTGEMAQYYTNIESAYKVSGKYLVSSGTNTKECTLGEDCVIVKMDGKWFMFLEDTDSLS